jgi:hypothetical protein
MHLLQGEAERVKPSQSLDLLREFYRDKRALVRRHEAAARQVPDYDVNNTYQYILAREEAHVSWLRTAIEELDGQLAEPDVELALPGTKGPAGWKALAEDDARLMQEFVDRWRDRVEQISNARHKGIMRVILGEALEHKRFFDQALAGRTDLLGRRADGAGTGGGVLPARWIE